jgi:hypothetical protein
MHESAPKLPVLIKWLGNLILESRRLIFAGQPAASGQLDSSTRRIRVGSGSVPCDVIIVLPVSLFSGISLCIAVETETSGSVYVAW